MSHIQNLKNTASEYTKKTKELAIANPKTTAAIGTAVAAAAIIYASYKLGKLVGNCSAPAVSPEVAAAVADALRAKSA